MPRTAKGPRLYLRKGRIDRRTKRALPDLWVILDGKREIGTGCYSDGPTVPEGARRKLSEHLAAQFQAPGPDTPDRRRDPNQVMVVEVLAAYAAGRAPALGLDPATMDGFIDKLTAFWTGRTLADVKRSTCQAYLADRITQPDARYRDADRAPRISERTASRELDVLGGAIAWWHGEDTLTTRPVVWRPEPAESPRDALTRSQAAALLWAALGRRRGPDGAWTPLQASSRRNRRHLARFILIGLYTGTRHGVMRKLLWEESAVNAWVDLDAGMIYRRGREERDNRTKRRPVVKLPPRLLAHMRRWRKMDGIEEARRRRVNDDYRLVSVLHHGGEPLSGKIRTGWEGCVRDAGLPGEITPHWMRHTAATWLMEADAKPWDAAAYLGMTVETLEKHYGHHRPTYQAGPAGKIGRK